MTTGAYIIRNLLHNRRITPKTVLILIIGAVMYNALLYKCTWMPIYSTSVPCKEQVEANRVISNSGKLNITVRYFEEPEEEKWTNKTKIHITERRFTASENGRVFILGVVAKNSTPAAHWDEFVVYGQWYDVDKIDENYLFCCFKDSDGKILEQQPTAFNIRNYRLWSKIIMRAPLPLWHITCRKPSQMEPHWVSIDRHSNCSSDHVAYLEPYYAKKQPDGYHVITTKFAYESINPHMVVSFLETMKYLGIDKVVTYVLPSLDPVVKSILGFYSHKGLLDYYRLELADMEKVHHKFDGGKFNAQYISDEWLVKKDALERNIGSTYFGIFDMDEFLIPSGNRSYKRLLNDLRQKFPDASHFFFKNVHYLVDARTPDEACAPNCTVFKRFLHTSPLRFNNIHEKMFLLTDRVLTQSLDNHYVMSLPGYRRVTCPETEAYMRHYGGCGRKFPKWVCNRRKTWAEDRSMVDWANSTVTARIQAATEMLGLSLP